MYNNVHITNKTVHIEPYIRLALFVWNEKMYNMFQSLNGNFLYSYDINITLRKFKLTDIF